MCEDCNSVAANTKLFDKVPVKCLWIYAKEAMNAVFSECTSVFDDDTLDQLNSNLFTREWTQVGTLEGNNCTKHGLVPQETCPHCNNNPKLIGRHLNVVYVIAVYDNEGSDCEVPDRYNELRGPGNELASVQFMPLDPRCYYTLYPYLSTRTAEPERGETLMNVCTSGTKTPCIRIPWCLVAKYNGAAPEEYASIGKAEDDWVLFVPHTALMDIFSLMEEHDMYPTPDGHDGRAYSSSRLRVAGTVSSRVIKPEQWNVGRDLKTVRRYLNCDAVATATFTVTVHLTPYKGSRGRHTRYKHLTLWVHSIQ